MLVALTMAGPVMKFMVRRRLDRLACAETCFPLDIFSTARLIADLNAPRYAEALIGRWGPHPNAFVRRCMLTTVRFAGADLFRRCKPYVSSMLEDGNPWVRYDAAWIIQNHGPAQEGDLQRLRVMGLNYLSKSVAELAELRPEDPAESAAIRAAQALLTHDPSSAGSG